MSCQPAARDAVRAAQRALVDVDCVADATVFAPDVGPRDCWVLEVIVADPDRVPNVVVDELGSAGLDLCLPLQRQGEHSLVVATAE